MQWCLLDQRRSNQRRSNQRSTSNLPGQSTISFYCVPAPRAQLFLLLLVGIMLTLSACGQRATGGNTIKLAEEYNAAVDLPAFVIDYNVEGIPSVGGMPLDGFLDLFGLTPDSAALFHLDPALISQLTQANIQHIQLDNSVSGIVLLINGEPIPSLVWDEASLVAMAEVLDMAGYGIELLDNVLPLIQTVGVGTIVRFPIAEDVPLIPTVVIGEETAAQTMQDTQSSFEEAVGSAAQIQVIVTYTEDGRWTVANMDATQWSQIVPAPWEDLNLSPSMVAQLSKQGVETISFATNRDGFFVSVNDKTLPYLAWGEGELQHLLALLSKPETLAYITGASGDNLGPIIQLAEQWIPVLQLAETRLTVNFPE